MPRPRILAAALLTGSLTLSGCGVLGSTTSDSPTAAGPAATATSASAAASKKAGGAGTLPDICTLLTKADVTGLTGQKVTLMSNEGGNTAGARYCQWQLTNGQLTVTVDVETRQQFDVQNKEAKQVDGIGETAYSLAGHLYVYAAGKAVDVYATSAGTDAGNLKVEQRAAAAVLPKLA
jgi:hypothetical protein